MGKFTSSERSGLIFIIVIITLVVSAILLTRNTIQIQEIKLEKNLDGSISSPDDSMSYRPSAKKHKKGQSDKKRHSTAPQQKGVRSPLDEPVNTE
ncbi:MAG: hypothetical protein K2M94_01795 [Paramuribaculum sp.]|nr:hypothetical protein [Paramuribaculum sp.]